MSNSGLRVRLQPRLHRLSPQEPLQERDPHSPRPAPPGSGRQPGALEFSPNSPRGLRLGGRWLLRTERPAVTSGLRRPRPGRGPRSCGQSQRALGLPSRFSLSPGAPLPRLQNGEGKKIHRHCWGRVAPGAATPHPHSLGGQGRIPPSPPPPNTTPLLEQRCRRSRARRARGGQSRQPAAPSRVGTAAPRPPPHPQRPSAWWAAQRGPSAARTPAPEQRNVGRGGERGLGCSAAQGAPGRPRGRELHPPEGRSEGGAPRAPTGPGLLAPVPVYTRGGGGEVWSKVSPLAGRAVIWGPTICPVPHPLKKSRQLHILSRSDKHLTCAYTSWTYSHTVTPPEAAPSTGHRARRGSAPSRGFHHSGPGPGLSPSPTQGPLRSPPPPRHTGPGDPAAPPGAPSSAGDPSSGRPVPRSA